ncbi:MAG: hypothetical protein WAQ05_16400 [Rubrivivax sp.]
MASPRASLRFQRVADIDVRGWDEIWRLTCRFYATERPWVERRLKSFDELLLFRSRADRQLVGMAAMAEDVITFQGRRVVVIFTQHTVVDPRYRGHNLLQRAAVRRMWRCWLDHPLKPRYWAFDTSSARGYLLLPGNLRDYWPRRNAETPAWEAQFIAEYGSRRYGEAWQGAGTVRASPKKRLLPTAAPLRADASRQPELAFFEQRNPGHADGDALLCLVPLTWANAWQLLKRAVARWARRRMTGT